MTQQPSAHASHRWPEGAIVYHIYPRSFQDTNDDGVGDLPGIIKRLDYIQSLGANAIWLSPFYPSPMADFGYDVSDYCDVHPLFGTLDDFKQLLEQAHARSMRILVDLVPSHTSDEHMWFQQSQQSKDNPYTDWYTWQDAKGFDDHVPLPPNNWRDALTGRSAWQWSEKRHQFYLHSFDVRQPDLNWSNPEVREMIKDVMRFWLDMGVDGFRVDAVYWLAKDPLLGDDSPNPKYIEGKDEPYEALLHNNSRGWPFVYAYLSEMADVLKEKPYQHTERFMVTEAYPDLDKSLQGYLNFYAAMDPEVASPFNFEGLILPWQAQPWRKFLKSFHYALNQFNSKSISSYAFGNHDKPRLASRLGDAASRSAAVMLLTLPGMTFVYYGEEIGMKNVAIPPELSQDPAARGRGDRDPERTPMQWSAAQDAGFSNAAATWLPVAPDYQQNNVEAQNDQPNAHLTLYRTLGRLRNETEALKHGRIEVIVVDNTDVLGYQRIGENGDRCTTLINFSNEAVTCRPGVVRLGKLVVSSDPQTTLAEAVEGEITLLPWEGALFLDAADQS